MEKDKAIFFGIVGGMLVLLIVYISFTFGGNKNKDPDEQSFDSPDYRVEEKKHQYQSRVDEITKNRYEAPERENPLDYDFAEEPVEEKGQEQSAEEKKKEEISKKARRSISAPVKKSESAPVSISHEISNQESNENIKPVQEEKEITVSYGFSSASGENNNTKKSSQENLWAQLDEKTTVMNNSSQVFLLEKSAVIGGRTYPANSKLYTTAVVKADYIDILVTRIKDINTHEEFLVDMYAVNENRTRGIKYQGKINKESDEASRNLLSETSRALYRRYNVEGVAEAAGDGIEEIVGRDKIEVPVSKGYRLIFIEN